jgi:hypothetical protein
MGGKLQLIAEFPNRPPVEIEHIGAGAAAPAKTSKSRRASRSSRVVS